MVTIDDLKNTIKKSFINLGKIPIGVSTKPSIFEGKYNEKQLKTLYAFKAVIQNSIKELINITIGKAIRDEPIDTKKLLANAIRKSIERMGTLAIGYTNVPISEDSQKILERINALKNSIRYEGHETPDSAKKKLEDMQKELNLANQNDESIKNLQTMIDENIKNIGVSFQNRYSKRTDDTDGNNVNTPSENNVNTPSGTGVNPSSGTGVNPSSGNDVKPPSGNGDTPLPGNNGDTPSENNGDTPSENNGELDSKDDLSVVDEKDKSKIDTKIDSSLIKPLLDAILQIINEPSEMPITIDIIFNDNNKPNAKNELEIVLNYVLKPSSNGIITRITSEPDKINSIPIPMSRLDNEEIEKLRGIIIKAIEDGVTGLEKPSTISDDKLIEIETNIVNGINSLFSSRPPNTDNSGVNEYLGALLLDNISDDLNKENANDLIKKTNLESDLILSKTLKPYRNLTDSDFDTKFDIFWKELWNLGKQNRSEILNGNENLEKLLKSGFLQSFKGNKKFAFILNKFLRTTKLNFDFGTYPEIKPLVYWSINDLTMNESDKQTIYKMFYPNEDIPTENPPLAINNNKNNSKIKLIGDIITNTEPNIELKLVLDKISDVLIDHKKSLYDLVLDAISKEFDDNDEYNNLIEQIKNYIMILEDDFNFYDEVVYPIKEYITNSNNNVSDCIDTSTYIIDLWLKTLDVYDDISNEEPQNLSNMLKMSKFIQFLGVIFTTNQSKCESIQ
jgi:hypothetical protein